MTRSVGCHLSGRRDRTRARSWRIALAAGFGAAVLLAGDTANAQLFQPMFGYPQYPRWRVFEPARPYYGPYYHKPTRKPVEPTKKEAKAKPLQGPLLIAISLDTQRLTLYSDGAPVAHSPVSTGTADHPTPAGIFSVIGKERFHRSNLYSNAPMPFMQRITWSGVALHQGVLPGYPASHGCIRLPERFALYLWGTTRMGARVIITHDEAVPFDIAHDKLFAPRPNVAPDIEREPKADQVQASTALKVAATDDPVRTSDAPKPARLGTVEHDDVSTVQLKGSLDTPMRGAAVSKAPPTAASKKAVVAAGELSDVIDAQAPSPTAMDATTPGEAAASTSKRGHVVATESKETPRMSDPVSVFISRRTGRLYVRQGFEPLFETTVTIRDADVPLGTHLYTAIAFKEDRTAMRWTAVTLAERAASEPEPRRTGKKKKRDEREPAAHVPESVRLAATAALDRVEMPQDAIDRISDLLSPGASLIISDYPLSNETGKYTDFIVLTR